MTIKMTNLKKNTLLSVLASITALSAFIPTAHAEDTKYKVLVTVQDQNGNYLKNQEVCYDVTGNLKCDKSDIKAKTDSSGYAELKLTQTEYDKKQKVITIAEDMNTKKTITYSQYLFGNDSYSVKSEDKFLVYLNPVTTAFSDFAHNEKIDILEAQHRTVKAFKIQNNNTSAPLKVNPIKYPENTAMLNFANNLHNGKYAYKTLKTSNLYKAHKDYKQELVDTNNYASKIKDPNFIKGHNNFTVR